MPGVEPKVNGEIIPGHGADAALNVKYYPG